MYVFTQMTNSTTHFQKIIIKLICLTPVIFFFRIVSSRKFSLGCSNTNNNVSFEHCSRCRGDIGPTDLVMKARSSVFHVECFRYGHLQVCSVTSGFFFRPRQKNSRTKNSKLKEKTQNSSKKLKDSANFGVIYSKNQLILPKNKGETTKIPNQEQNIQNIRE